MTNHPFEQIEEKEFNLKFSFEMLTSTIMFAQKVQTIFPDEKHPVHKECNELIDNIIDQLSEKDLNTLNNYFKAMHLDNQLDNS